MRTEFTMWKTHKIKRKVRSTIASEACAANKCLEASDLLRTHLVEILTGKPLDRKRWRSEANVVNKGPGDRQQEHA